MAKKKKQQKKKRKKSHKGRSFFSDNAYNTYVYDHLKYRRKRQRGGFLNRYDFAYAGRDTVNQASKQLNALAQDSIKYQRTVSINSSKWHPI